MGLLLKVVVHPANIQDRDGAKLLLDGVKERFPRLSIIWADHGYNGPKLGNWVKENLACSLIIPNRRQGWVWIKEDEEIPSTPVMPILPRRWVVERTFAWKGRNRRLSKDYEGLPETEEAFVYLAMVCLMLRRLAL